MKEVKARKESQKAFFYALGYVGLSTIYLYSAYPSDPFAFLNDNELISTLLLILTFPGIIFSFGIRFAGCDSVLQEFFLVFFAQSISVLIWWRIIRYARQ